MTDDSSFRLSRRDFMLAGAALPAFVSGGFGGTSLAQGTATTSGQSRDLATLTLKQASTSRV